MLGLSRITPFLRNGGRRAHRAQAHQLYTKGLPIRSIRRAEHAATAGSNWRPSRILDRLGEHDARLRYVEAVRSAQNEEQALAA